MTMTECKISASKRSPQLDTIHTDIMKDYAFSDDTCDIFLLMKASHLPFLSTVWTSTVVFRFSENMKQKSDSEFD